MTLRIITKICPWPLDQDMPLIPAIRYSIKITCCRFSAGNCVVNRKELRIFTACGGAGCVKLGLPCAPCLDRSAGALGFPMVRCAFEYLMVGLVVGALLSRLRWEWRVHVKAAKKNLWSGLYEKGIVLWCENQLAKGEAFVTVRRGPCYILIGFCFLVSQLLFY